ncbi:hypothetical protein CsSME_00050691 [Camellia sinensis var. sinensis]
MAISESTVKSPKQVPQEDKLPAKGGIHWRAFEEPKTHHVCLYQMQLKPCRTSKLLASEVQENMNQDFLVQFDLVRALKLFAHKPHQFLVQPTTRNTNSFTINHSTI